jgi:hypothetical protein
MRVSWRFAIAAPVAVSNAAPARTQLRLLEPHSETRAARASKFVAAEAFRIGGKIGTRTLSSVGLTFAYHFLPIVESNVPAATLKGLTLLLIASDAALVNALPASKRPWCPSYPTEEAISRTCVQSLLHACGQCIGAQTTPTRGALEPFTCRTGTGLAFRVAPFWRLLRSAHTGCKREAACSG